MTDIKAQIEKLQHEADHTPSGMQRLINLAEIRGLKAGAKAGWEDGCTAGQKSVYLGRYGHNEGLELMYSKTKNPFEERVCPLCLQPGWDGEHHADRNSTSCFMCGWQLPPPPAKKLKRKASR